MTKTMPRINSLRRRMTAAMLLLLTGSGSALAKRNAMKTDSMSIWSIIEVLSKQLPFTKERIEAVFGTRLEIDDADDSDIFQFFKAGHVSLAEGVELSEVELRLKRGGGHPGLLVLQLEGRCVNLDQVRTHFSKLEITDVPRGRSSDEETTHTAKLAWADVSFGFAERNPKCVATISISPRKQ